VSFNGSGVFQINTAGQPVVSGTVISSTAFNALTADLATGLSTCVTKDGQTTPTANLPMANYKFTGLGAGTDAGDSATLGQVQSTVVKLIGSVSGTDTITGSLTPALTAYAAGQMFYFVAAGDNTGAVTININSLGAKNVTKDGTTALSAAEIKSGQTVVVVYDGTRFQMVNPVVVGLIGATTSAKTALGIAAGDSVTTGTLNTFVGENAGTSVTTGVSNTAIGYDAGGGSNNPSFTTYVGYQAGRNVQSNGNTGVGNSALQGVGTSATGGNNTGIGFWALREITTGASNTAVGNVAGDSINSGAFNVCVGSFAGSAITSGGSNTVLGYSAGGSITTGQLNCAIGDAAYSSGNYQNSACLGYNSQVTGSDQVQLGDSNTTTYVYGSVQNRSDARDKTEIADTNLGLDFVMALKPRKFKWDMREDYRTTPPVKPNPVDFPNDDAYQAAISQWQDDYSSWQEASKLANLTHNGTHKRNRFHYGLVAQEVKATMDAMGVDFGGYQDHSVKGGDDVLSIGYEEMIAPLIKAIQELKAEFDAYKATHP